MLIGYAVIIFILLVLGTISIIILEGDLKESLEDGLNMVTIVFVFLYLASFNLSMGTVGWYYNTDILQGKSVGFAVAIF